MAPMAFVPEGDPSMMGGPLAIEGAGGKAAEGGDQSLSGDPNDFADDAGASSLAICLNSNLKWLTSCRDLQEFWDDEPPRSWGRWTNERFVWI